MNAAFDLTGRVALVTGARTGIGQAMAIALAEAGADIVGLGSSPMPDTAKIVRKLGRRFEEQVIDLSKDFQVEAVLDAVITSMGRIDILVNNAGIIRRHDLPDFPLEDWDLVQTVNLRAAFQLSQAVAQHLPDGGRILMTASVLSDQGGIRVPAYTASKHGIVGLTKALANELAPRGITVNAIAPGYIATDNTAALQADSERSRQILERIPAGRWGNPDDLKAAAVFLAGPGASYVTGTVIRVDGGWMAR